MFYNKFNFKNLFHPKNWDVLRNSKWPRTEQCSRVRYGLLTPQLPAYMADGDGLSLLTLGSTDLERWSDVFLDIRWVSGDASFVGGEDEPRPLHAAAEDIRLSSDVGDVADGETPLNSCGGEAGEDFGPVEAIADAAVTPFERVELCRIMLRERTPKSEKVFWLFQSSD